MKNFTKILSMVLLVAMCMSMLTVSAFADCEHPADQMITTSAREVSCDADGVAAHSKCNACDMFFDADGKELGTDSAAVLAQVVIPALNHANKEHHAAAAATCQGAGNAEYYYCPDCGKYFSGDGVTETSLGSVSLAAKSHEKGTQHAAVAPDCDTDGNIEYFDCVYNCGTKLDANGAVITNVVDPATDHSFNANGICPECGAKENAPAPFAVSGDTSIDYANASSFSYLVVDPDTYELASVRAGDQYLVRGAGLSYDNATGTITITKAALSAIIDGKSSIELVFTADDGSSVGGFMITNSANIVVDDLFISGLTQNKYIQDSGKKVSFQTNLTDPSCVKIFNGSTQLDVPTSGYTFTAAYGDVYTYAFDNTFLDNLDCGYYQIRCYYGNSNSEFVTPGTLMISDSNTNVDDVLYFVNSTQGDNEYFKYVSGDEVPRMYCGLFLVDGARLQVSTNGGKSWSNVNVHNYYIETTKGKDTSHAWIGSDYLDSLNADTIYYFRVVVPASANGTNADWTSNVVSVTTGPTLKALDTAKHVINSTKNLKFVASEKVTKVYVGNVQLTDENDFSISNDGKTITLSPSFLNKRTAGSTYTIKVLTASGEYASTTFQILTTAQASASPRTGDTSNIGLWTAALILSAGAGVAVLPRLKKED